jgi:site-specific recombinase XerD
MDELDIELIQMRFQGAQAYQGWLIDRGKNDGTRYSNNSIHPYVISAKSFYEFLKRKRLIASNPFAFIKRVRRESKLPGNILKEQQMVRLLDELEKFCEQKGLKAKTSLYRVHVIAELMYSSGLRISEVAALREQDIDFNRGIVRVIEGKAGFDRTAFLNDYAASVIRLYIKRMRKYVLNDWHKDSPTLFGSGQDCMEKLVNKVLKTTCPRLGLPRMSSHGFRHALGFHLLRGGCDIRCIQEILGHKSIKNTEIYTKVEKEDLRNVLDRHHPRQFRRVSNEKPYL